MEITLKPTMRKLENINGVQLTGEIWENINSSESGIVQIGEISLGVVKFNDRKYFLIEDARRIGSFTKAEIGDYLIIEERMQSLLLCKSEVFDKEFSFIDESIEPNFLAYRKFYEEETSDAKELCEQSN